MAKVALSILTEHEVEEIAAKALEILWSPGVKITSDFVLKKLRDAGAQVRADQTAQFDTDTIPSFNCP